MLKLVNSFARATDTRSVERWDFSPAGNIHLIGIRRNEMSGRFDDVFVLLIKGLVFKFQGSTEPGAAGNAAGAAFLVQGQHDYHFGWHKSQYLALRPQHLDKGVLTVRSSSDLRLEDADLARLELRVALLDRHVHARTMGPGCALQPGHARVRAMLPRPPTRTVRPCRSRDPGHGPVHRPGSSGRLGARHTSRRSSVPPVIWRSRATRVRRRPVCAK